MSVAMKFVSSPRTTSLLAPKAPKPSRFFTPSLGRSYKRPLVCSASSQDPQPEKKIVEKMALPAATILAAALLFASTPEDALAARSGGRVGGSSGFSSRSSMPRASVPRSSGPTVRNYNYYSAPPIFSPYGFGMPFYGGGIGIAPMPFFGIGTIFNILILMFIVNTILQVVSNFTNGSGRGRDDDEDDRWD